MSASSFVSLSSFFVSTAASSATAAASQASHAARTCGAIVLPFSHASAFGPSFS
jgi:hypothetical protein